MTISLPSALRTFPTDIAPSHCEDEEYFTFIGGLDMTRTMKNRYIGQRRDFVTAFPDLALWCEQPLEVRVGRLHGASAFTPEHPASFWARQYLYYLAFTDRLRLDYGFLLSISPMYAALLANSLGIDLGIPDLRKRQIAMGYHQTTPQGSTNWVVSRIALHAGIRSPELISPDNLEALNDAISAYAASSLMKRFHGYDPQKAKALLQEAGISGPLTIDLWAMPVQRPYNPNAKRMAEMIQADWAKIGVQAKIVTYEWGEYLKRAKAGEHQSVMMGWTGDNGDPDNFFATLFSCAAAKDGSNYSRWCYKPFEDLIQPARATDDHNKRIELYKQAQVVMHDQAPALIIAHSTVYEPVRKEVKGYVVDPLGKHHFDNVSVE